MTYTNDLEKYSKFLKNTVLSLFSFKIILIFLYFIGDYQLFATSTVKLLSRFILSTDIINFVANSAYLFFLLSLKILNIRSLLFLIFNILFSIVTILTALLVIVL